MITLEVTQKFSAAHYIKNAGKCANVHGHNYVIKTAVKGMIEDYFLMDAKVLKQIVQVNILNLCDHQLLNDVFEFVPSCELLCNEFAKLIQRQLPKNIKLHSLELQETDTIKCVWYGE